MKNAKKFVVIIIIISIFASSIFVEASATGTLAYGAATVDTPKLNVRTGPGLTHSVVSVLNEGDIVVILNRTNSEWYHINYRGLIGYVSAALLRDVLTAENFNATGVITGDYVNMRSMPNTSSGILMTCPEKTKMAVIGINSGWYKVTHDGYTGYIRSDYMAIVSETETLPATASSTSPVSVASAPNTTPANLALGQEIADFAFSFLGSRYVHAGASPDGFDCSGLVFYVYGSFGYSLNRTPHGQYTSDGVPVDKANLVPGDLVFFSSNGGVSVTHVGVYIGDNEFVHASTPAVGVIIGRLDSAYYTRVWHGAKRIV